MQIKFDRGFTLLELLMGLSIFAIISSAIYASFSVSIRVLKISKSNAEWLQQIRFGFEEITNDIKNSVSYSTIKPEFGKNQMSFVTIKNYPDATLKKVSYFFDLDNNHVKKISKSLKTGEETTRVFFKNLSDFNIRYSQEGLVLNEIDWVENWKQNNIPRGIKIFLKTKINNEEIEFSRVIYNPCGFLQKQR